MFYSFDFTIPAATAKNSPAQLDLKLTAGVITQVTVQFPPGPQNLVFLVLMEGSHQLYPSNQGGTFHWDNYAVEWPDRYSLAQVPYVIRALGWAPTTSYDHIVTIRIALLPGAEGASISQRLLSLLGRE